MTLHPAFLGAPIAHRAYHGPGKPENSRAAVRAAVEAGYGIEIDLQPAADGTPMVFHDPTLDRMTNSTGPITARTMAELGQTQLAGTVESIPTLAEILQIIAGRVALLVEIKDQGAALGALEARTAEVLAGYDGPLAVMSFNPHSVLVMASAAPAITRGLTTCDFSVSEFDSLPEATRQDLNDFAHYGPAGASFVSHDFHALAMPAVTKLKATGAPILSWTIKSPADEAKARQVAANVTFEGYPAPIPGLD